jgi:small subunit ribosomal protein S5
MIHATFAALKKQGSPRSVAARRGKKVSDLITRRRDDAHDASEVEAAS